MGYAATVGTLEGSAFPAGAAAGSPGAAGASVEERFFAVPHAMSAVKVRVPVPGGAVDKCGTSEEAERDSCRADKGDNGDLLKLALKERATGSLICKLIDYTGQCEQLFSLLAQNERLQGRLVAVCGGATISYAYVPAGRARASSVSAAREGNMSLVKEVSPSLGVRIHEVKPLRDGGAVIRTSVAEGKKIVENTKFNEVGLDVSVNYKVGPKVVVHS